MPPPTDLARTPPDRDGAYVVFAQRRDARVDVDGWNTHASRFFRTRIGLGEERRYPPGVVVPTTDAVPFVVAPDGGTPGVRWAFARPSDAEDLALAEAADTRAGMTGLALLARRCPMVWRVALEGEGDALALRLAAIFASVLLGPILDARSAALFGAKTARAKLEAGAR